MSFLPESTLGLALALLVPLASLMVKRQHIGRVLDDEPRKVRIIWRLFQRLIPPKVLLRPEASRPA